MKTEPTIPTASDTSARPKLCFDWRDWLPYVADMEASDAEKRETIETLWSIVLAFVDAGWEIRGHDEPDEKTCGQNLDLAAALRSAVLNSKGTETRQEDA